LVLLCALLAAAQQYPPPAPPNQPPPDQTTTQVGTPADQQQAVRGCLSGSANNFTLTSSTGEIYQVTSDQDLSAHVGHTVEIRGNLRQAGASEVSTDAMQGEIQATQIQHIAETCEAAAQPRAGEPQAAQAPMPQPGESQAPTSAEESAATTPGAVTGAAPPPAEADVPAEGTTMAQTQPPPAAPPDQIPPEPAAEQALPPPQKEAEPAPAGEPSTAREITDEPAVPQDEEAALPATASLLPLLWFLGLGSLGAGLLARRN
jgi:hypothetical protein